ncbi:DUF664 domain-containing protein [Streptomyces sp. NPDC047117]|uniref:mycothiol transferase n=1 Tax=Streptomyces sp. NPDC047117 TaxID=3155379 RepID=UPI0033C4F07D
MGRPRGAGCPTPPSRDRGRKGVGHLEWYREAVLRKISGLSDDQLRTPVEPLHRSPLGLVQHLGRVERRWLRWGFAAEDVLAWLTDKARVGGRFSTPDQAPSLGRILFHLLQE